MLDKRTASGHKPRMKKVFPMHVQGHEPPRVLEQIKRDVRRYLKRERQKALPEGADFWDFDCVVGPDRSSPETTHPADIGAKLDRAFTESWPEVYIELVAKPGHRKPKV